MNNIFDSNNLYPGYDVPLREYFKGYFDSVFICFSPFFFLKNDISKDRSLRNAQVITLQELQARDEIFRNLDPSVQRTIYSYENFKYPSNEEMIERGVQIKWSYIKDKGGFDSFAEMNIALRTSIGAFLKEYQRHDLQRRLDKFTDAEFIYNPVEGRINPLSLMQIYDSLKALNKTELVVTDEFYEERKTVNLNELSCSEFVLQCHGFMYYFPVDRSLLFTIEWDSFFYLIAGNSQSLEQLILKFDFEGFYADDTTLHNWEFD